MAAHEPAIAVESICQSCGACCATSANWPRFSTEDDAALDLIPAELVNARGSGMRCDGDRCAALKGKVGEATSCSIYDDAARRLPDLHARRRRMRDRAEEMGIAGPRLSRYATGHEPAHPMGNTRERVDRLGADARS